MSVPLVKITAPASAPLTAALHRLVAVMQPPAATITAGDAFTVQVGGDGGRPIPGVTPALKALKAQAPHPPLFGTTAEERALVGQWVSLALQLSAKVATLDDAELLVPPQGSVRFLGGTDGATVADLLMYSVCAAELSTAGAAASFPKLARWAVRAESDALVAPLKAATASAAVHVDPRGATAPAEAAAAAKPKFAIPTAEEIAARKLQKEKEKAEKARLKAAQQSSTADKEAAGGSGGGGGGGASPDAPQLDIRVGRIVEVAQHATAEKLFIEQIDVGEAAPRTIVSGLVPYYSAADLRGSMCLVVCNMKPKKLQGVESNGMVLCAAAESKLELISAPAAPDVAPGTQVVFGKNTGAPRPPVGAKKIAEHLAALRTDGAGRVVWNGEPLSVGGQPLASECKDAPVK